jgi:hypothetical protein
MVFGLFIFTHVMLSFTWLTCVLLWFKSIYLLSYTELLRLVIHGW